MSPVKDYIDELAAALLTRGRRRRRILAECESHLADSTADHGEAAAVAGFGPAGQIAAALDLESAAALGLRATGLSAVGVAATAASTLVLIHSAVPGTHGPWGLALTFFVAAQLAAVAMFAGVTQAAALRHRSTSASDLSLLARRDTTAILASSLTMLTAGAALPGHGPALLLLAGPVTLTLAGVTVWAARRLARRLPHGTGRALANPLADAVTAIPFGLADGAVLRRVIGALDPTRRPATCCALAAALAGSAAFVRDVGEGATLTAAAMATLIEAIAVVTCFFSLGPILGLRVRRAGGLASGR